MENKYKIGQTVFFTISSDFILKDATVAEVTQTEAGYKYRLKGYPWDIWEDRLSGNRKDGILKAIQEERKHIEELQEKQEKRLDELKGYEKEVRTWSIENDCK